MIRAGAASGFVRGGEYDVMHFWSEKTKEFRFMLAKKEWPLYCEVGCGLALPVSYGFTAPLNEGRAALRGRNAFFGMRVTNTVFQGNHSTKPVWLARIAGPVPVHA